MAKFHINDKGDMGLCRAQNKCPYGGESGEENHYDTPEAAFKAFEERMATELIPQKISKQKDFKKYSEPQWIQPIFNEKSEVLDSTEKTQVIETISRKFDQIFLKKENLLNNVDPENLYAYCSKSQKSALMNYDSYMKGSFFVLQRYKKHLNIIENNELSRESRDVLKIEKVRQIRKNIDAYLQNSYDNYFNQEKVFNDFREFEQWSLEKLRGSSSLISSPTIAVNEAITDFITHNHFNNSEDQKSFSYNLETLQQMAIVIDPSHKEHTDEALPNLKEAILYNGEEKYPWDKTWDTGKGYELLRAVTAHYRNYVSIEENNSENTKFKETIFQLQKNTNRTDFLEALYRETRLRETLLSDKQAKSFYKLLKSSSINYNSVDHLLQKVYKV